MDYATFLASKKREAPSSGIACEPGAFGDDLFDFQAHIVEWAVRRGRAAIWADTGLGKTRMQVEWLRHVLRDGQYGLILAPLAVAQQTIREAAVIGTTVTYAHDASEVAPGITITNYDRLHKFDAAVFDAVVLDESSILKAYSGTTKRALVEAFKDTPFRLACTATPAPNDLEELCNHAHFLGVMTPAEMRSTFFIADSRGEFMKYRIKGHAKEAFYEWLASWAIACRTPADLGFDPSLYELPPLTIMDHSVESDWAADGELFTPQLQGITQRAQVRHATLEARVAAALDLVRAEPNEQWLLWCGLNSESEQLTSGVREFLPNVVEVKGNDDPDVKAAALMAFGTGEIQVLVTKPAIAAYGLNFQSCSRMAFVGLSDSYEQYYQAIRRCYRFGQTRPVHAHIILADVEHVIAANVRAKERQARSITAGLVAAISAENRHELFAGTSKSDSFDPTKQLVIPNWLRSEAS